jgi:effector-binding domain-containing protein
MLTQARAEAERAVTEGEARLSRIGLRLTQLELEKAMPTYDVVLKDVPSMLVAAKRVTIPTNDQVPAYLGPAFDATYAMVKRSGAGEAGPCIAIWHQPASVLANEVVDAVVPIERKVGGSEGVDVYELPAGRVVSVVHEGLFEGMAGGHAALLSWVEANGYEMAGTYREVYVRTSHARPEENVTEIQYPVVVRG